MYRAYFTSSISTDKSHLFYKNRTGKNSTSKEEGISTVEVVWARCKTGGLPQMSMVRETAREETQRNNRNDLCKKGTEVLKKRGI